MTNQIDQNISWNLFSQLLNMERQRGVNESSDTFSQSLIGCAPELMNNLKKFHSLGFALQASP